MWFRDFKDIPNDTPVKRQQVEPGHGIIGCEMHEICGYQQAQHSPPSRKPGVVALFLGWLFGDNKNGK
ncbi:MAG: hypothetical protein KDK78_09810 [Chlamydiia bacterium]|nr:hypothetical protein [Chlamydiia bacterium]